MKNFTANMAIVVSFVLAFALLSGTIIAQDVKGKGNLQTQDRKVANFKGIKVSGGFLVEVKQGKQEGLRIEAEERLMDKIVSEVKNGVLHIYTKGSVNSRKGMKAYITVNELEKVEISGGVKVVGLSTFKAGDFQLDMSGGSNVKLAIDAKKIFSNMSGASKVVLTGRADELKLDMSGASNVDTQELAAKRVKVSASGASKIKVNASETLQINASGASNIAYAGSPKIQAETTAASKISKL
ncbi:head GIN domain-containing protein [Pontibacter pudoricolor]|uniref:head GIN domain-containing protein n=1 Tax=Pontibacter pudoricolor TaxID=2694930 RepID=UPI0013918356|nr:head GIN domain-containing protein [Pontibacter pudoricolor]